METHKLLQNLRKICASPNLDESLRKAKESVSSDGIVGALGDDWREVFWLIIGACGFEIDANWLENELKNLSCQTGKGEAKKIFVGQTTLLNLGRVVSSLYTFPVIRENLAMSMAWIVRQEAKFLAKLMDEATVEAISRRTLLRLLQTTKNAEKIHEAAPKKVGRTMIYPVFHYSAPFRVQINAHSQNKGNTVFCVVAKTPKDYLAPIFFEGELLQFVKPDLEKKRWEKAAVRGSERIKGMLEKSRQC
jgi:hypothetical protein